MLVLAVIVHMLKYAQMGARPPAVASRGSIPQTRPPAQGAAHAAADPDSAQQPPDCRTGRRAPHVPLVL